MIEETNIVPAKSGSPARVIGFLALGLVIGIGGTLLLQRKKDHGAAGDQAPKKKMYQCAMHPTFMQDHPGDCPICGMKLVPMEDSGDKAPASAGKGKIVFYRSPMNPSLTSQEPRKDEMGMDYVPVYEGELKGDVDSIETHSVVTIDHERQQLIGLTTAKVRDGFVSGEVRTVGRVAVDETRVRKINVKVEGYVEKLYADFIGKPVGKGQPLFSVYAPEFVSAQREFLLALRTQTTLSQGSFKSSGNDLLEAARRRLLLWDVPKETLDQLEKTGEVQKSLTLRSPITGVVTAKNVVEGARITPADFPLEVTDLSHVWVQADAYETDLGRIKLGMPATLTLEAFPGKTFQGRVAFVDPLLDPKTRTAKVRIEFANPGLLLKPEMYGDVMVKGAGRKGMLIPRDAVLEAGTQSIAFIAVGDGRFTPRVVETGASIGEDVEILSGLKAGEEVVTRANFLVDSESRLKAAMAHLTAKPVTTKPAPAPAGHQH